MYYESLFQACQFGSSSSETEIGLLLGVENSIGQTKKPSCFEGFSREILVSRQGLEP